MYGKSWAVVSRGTGPTLAIIDYQSVSIPVGTILENNGQLWVVKSGARDLSQPEIDFGWLERTASQPAPTYTAPPPTTTYTAPPPTTTYTAPPPTTVYQPTVAPLTTVEIFIQAQGWVKQSNGQWFHPATGAVGYFLSDDRFVNATTNQVFDPNTGQIMVYSTVLAPPAGGTVPAYAPTPAELAPDGESFFTESFEIAGYQIPLWALLAGGAALLFAMARKR